MKRLEHLAVIAHDMGIIFEFLAVITLVPFVVLIIYQEWDMIIPMASVPLTFFILGFTISHAPRRDHVPRLSVALAAVALTWLTAAVVGSLPFVIGMELSLTDSIFEAMSGWTDTGITMISDLDSTPRTLIFWRSLMQWIGGIGVISFGIAMQSRSGLAQFRLYRSEGRSEDLMPSVVSTGRRMWVIYLVLTVLFTALVMFSGIPVFDAVNLTMVAIATGGFTPHDAGMAYYNNFMLEMLLIPAMLAGSFPFKVYFLMYRGKFRQIFRDKTIQIILLLSGLGSAIVIANLYIFGGLEFRTAFREGLFMSVSAATSTGFQNSGVNFWPGAALITVILLMFIGGASGSTAGGMKVNRVILAYEGMIWWFKRFFVRGNVIVPFKHDGKAYPKRISELELSKNLLITILYVLTVFVAVILALHITMTILPTKDVIFDIVSALGNNGLGAGFITPASTIPLKWLFIMLMWLGRLEIIPVLILITGIVGGFELNLSKYVKK